MKKTYTIIAFLLIVLVGSYFRLNQLSTLPISLFGDEVDVGYQAWSLATTGRDYMGHFLPTYAQSLSEWRAPLVMYLTAPFVGILGPSNFTVRFPIAILGIASIVLIFFVSRELFKRNSVALLCAALLSITPWHIHYSRASFEVVPLTFLILLGTYLFLKNKVTISLVPFILCFYTYSTAMVFIPLFVGGLIAIYRPKINLKKQWWQLALVSILLIPIVTNLLFGHSSSRFNSISIFNDPKMIDGLITQRTAPWVERNFTERFFQNKYFGVATSFFNNYLNAFSPDFLFLKGDQYFRHSAGKVGELLWPTILLFGSGVFIILQNIKQKENKLLVWWLLISPLASSLTQSGENHATRLFLMTIPLTLISSLGVVMLEKLKLNHKKIVVLIMSILIVFSFANYWNRYSHHYRFESANFWNYGYEQVFTELKNKTSEFDKVYINNTHQPSLLPFLFYTMYPPVQFQSNFTTDNFQSFTESGFTGFKLDEKYFFGQVSSLENFEKIMTPGSAYVAVQGVEIPGDWNWEKEPPVWVKSVFSTSDHLRTSKFYILKSSNE